MSFFIGKDNNNKPIVHLTNQVEGKSSLINGPISSTTFHSSLPYMQNIKTFTLPATRSVTSGTSSVDYNFTVEFSNEAIDLATQGYMFTVAVKTSNSSGVNRIVDTASRFFKRVGVSPAFDYNTTSTYPWGHTVNAANWEKSPSSTPSYTNRHCLLSSIYNYEDLFLYPHSYGPLGNNNQDTIIGNVATVVFYNIRNGALEILDTVDAITINSSTFTLGTPNGNISLEDFAPLKVSSVETLNSFSPRQSSSYILPYQVPISPVIGWEIDSTDPSNSRIIKHMQNGSSEIIVDSSSNNLILTSIDVVSYDVIANNGTSTESLGISVAGDEWVTVLANGTFVNGYTTKTTAGMTNFLSESGGYELSAFGRGHYHTNGVVYGDRYYLRFGVTSGDVKVQTTDVKDYTSGSYSGRFYGTATVLKFRQI